MKKLATKMASAIVNVGEYNALISLIERAIAFDAGAQIHINGFIMPENDERVTERYYIRARVGPYGKKWAIERNQSVLSKKSGQWLYEPSSSNRTDEFRRECYFKTLASAFLFFAKWKKKELARVQALNYPTWHFNKE